MTPPVVEVKQRPPRNASSGSANGDDVVESSMLKVKLRLLTKNNAELQEKLTQRDRQIEILQDGLKANLEMIQQLESMESREQQQINNIENNKKIKELEDKLQAEILQKTDLMVKLQNAESRIEEIQAGMETAVATAAAEARNHAAASTAAFVKEMEDVSDLLQKKIADFKKPSLSASASSTEQIKPGMKQNNSLSTGIVEKNKLFKGAARKIMIVQKVSRREKFTKWSVGLRKMDPRYQILDFFDKVAKTGAETVRGCEVEITGRCTKNCLEQSRMLDRALSTRSFSSVDEAEMVSNIFNKAGVFTVWRPTSFDSIRKMMEGEGCGKGLDIKGKSAKTGQFSGFVPFLQLHEKKHKLMCRSIPNDAKMRVFYTTKEIRDSAHKHLLVISVEMLAEYTKAQKTIERLRIEEETDQVVDAEAHDIMKEAALEKWMWDMEDPNMIILDDYAPDCWGLEVPQRLFFEAYVMRGDCQRDPGSIHDTGRKSEPAFQVR